MRTEVGAGVGVRVAPGVRPVVGMGAGEAGGAAGAVGAVVWGTELLWTSLPSPLVV